MELSYDPATQHATGAVSGFTGAVEYFAQAVDGAGNVALALDHGQPFRQLAASVAHGPTMLYLPLIRR